MLLRHSCLGDLTAWLESGCKKKNTRTAAWNVTPSCWHKVYTIIWRRDGIWNGLFVEVHGHSIGRNPLLIRKLPLFVELKAETSAIMSELNEPGESAPYFNKCYFNVHFNVILQTMYRSSKGCFFGGVVQTKICKHFLFQYWVMCPAYHCLHYSPKNIRWKVKL
jgi:hypothetical protein